VKNDSRVEARVDGLSYKIDTLGAELRADIVAHVAKGQRVDERLAAIDAKLDVLIDALTAFRHENRQRRNDRTMASRLYSGDGDGSHPGGASSTSSGSR
jgi:hypothetical protein